MVNAVARDFNSLVDYIAKFDETNYIAFDHTQITVNLNGLSDSAMVSSAKKALLAWERATGLDFVLSNSSSADIVINDDDSSGAYAGPASVTNNVISQSTVNVPTNWMDGFAESEQWGYGSYGLQTFIHEIGHALGLNHGGPYDGSGTYDDDAIYWTDTYQYSIMSYFTQSDNPYNGATDIYPLAPMIADIEAIKLLYGSLSVRTGNTLYGKGETTMGGVTDLSKYADAAYAIKDTGGIDTFDFSNEAARSIIDLRAGYFSDINGNVGNVAIAVGTVIENARGGRFSDTITGNGAANTLYGMAGNDKLIGGSGADKLVGGSGGDKLTGGSGGDDLYGGDGADTFIFKATGDSKTTSSLRDVIFDFVKSDGDRIDLSAIDAKSSVSGNQSFIYIGSDSYSGTKGELRVFNKNGDTFVSADINGDRSSDLMIQFDDTLSLSKGYFIL